MTSSTVPAGQYLPRAQGKPGPDEPVSHIHMNNTQNGTSHPTVTFKP